MNIHLNTYLHLIECSTLCGITISCKMIKGMIIKNTTATVTNTFVHALVLDIILSNSHQQMFKMPMTILTKTSQKLE